MLYRSPCLLGVALFVMTFMPAGLAEDEYVDLSQAVVRLNAPSPSLPLQTAVRTLIEEGEKRTGIRWPEVQETSDTVTIDIALAESGALPPEGFRFAIVEEPGRPATFQLRGADPRGVLFAVGYLLRHLEWGPGLARLPMLPPVESAPVYPIRGHQLGYRARANSYDAWDDAQYEQYVRELALFGANCIENIPFEDDDPSPHMKLTREAMNRRMSEICAAYDLDYWVWTPAVFDLTDTAKRAAELKKHEAFYKACPRLNGVFFPGGDPGNNHPREVMPFLRDIAAILAQYHPEARVWISLQGFEQDQVDYFYTWMDEQKPAWLGGVVCGPSSPPIPETRARLPKQYQIRHYPDITHTVRCQYPVQWWDPAFALTLGRECINPQPMYYALIHNAYAPYTNGFLSYSDGIHDDVNKAIWSQRGWDPDCDVRASMIEYARFFFGPKVAEEAADGILALEKNWEGPLAENGGVSATLRLWQDLEAKAPELEANWRWQMCETRAYYDAFTRDRLIYESTLETQANAYLLEHLESNAEGAMTGALAIVQRGDTAPCRPELRERIEGLYEALYHSIGLQSSVKKYQGSGYERGCSLDFLTYPLNNRWWLDDEFNRVRALPDDTAKQARLREIATWEHPSAESLYDDLGNLAKSGHVLRGEDLNTDPEMERDPNPGYWWWDSGFSRRRLSWQTTMDWPLALVYTALDPAAEYVLRLTGYGDAKPRVDGEAITPTRYEKEIGGIKEFPIPQALTADGAIRITWDKLDEAHLNWREQSRIAEAWLLKQR